MPKPRNAVPGRDVHVVLAEEDAARLELHLWSAAEQRIPYAARQRFFTERLKEFFSRQSIDLAAYFPNLPSGMFIVYGADSTMTVLKERLHVHA